MLIRRRLIAQIGFPDERFFIGGDDVAYGYLASKHSELLYLPRVCFIKKIVKVPATHATLSGRVYSRMTSPRPERFYFLLVRNELLLYSYIRDCVSSPRFFLRAGGILLRFSFIALVLERSVRNLSALWRGAREGWTLQSSRQADRESAFFAREI
jgi:rhamnopyranosyl-N-acetylglucosaminyl-diphospho-decaprenol beta-1,3/1,4-galactofuranosyltransferase